MFFCEEWGKKLSITTPGHMENALYFDQLYISKQFLHVV